MARQHPNQNVSFAPPSRRANDVAVDVPPRPPVKGYSKSDVTSPGASTSAGHGEPPLGYEEGYLEAGGANPVSFSASGGADVRRKKSMVRPERERMDPNHRLWHYREHAADDHLDVQPSCE